MSCQGGKPCKRQNRTKDIKPLEADNENDSSASDDYLYSLANPSLSFRKETPKTKVTVAGHKFSITVVTAASINVMDHETFSKLKGISLHKTNVKATHTMRQSQKGFLENSMPSSRHADDT